MSKGVFLGRAMLNRLVAAKAGLDPAVTQKVLDALDEVVLSQLQSGMSIRMFGGFLRIVKSAASRRRNIRNPDEYVDVPAGEKLVFRKSKLA